tara:strand:+ start:462 stop:641 length:180 start_codon:yes stop_codon:yes gene_type:complete
LKNKIDLLVKRIKLFEDKNLRDKAFENMDKKTQKIVMNVVKKSLTRIVKVSYIGGKINV